MGVCESINSNNNNNNNNDFNKEDVPLGCVEPIPRKTNKIIDKQLECYICKIYADTKFGTGFFCNIPYNPYNLGSWDILKVLITTNHVLTKDDLSLYKTINFSIKEKSKHYQILIDESRKIYTNEKYDITIVELKESDKIGRDSFFDIDNRIFKENSNEIFRNSQVFLLHYPKGNQLAYSPGIIKNISEDKYTIYHLCDTSCGSSGGPLINSFNFQVIGIHKGASTRNYNIGTLLKEPLKFFFEETNQKKILILIKQKQIFMEMMKVNSI